jgi:drug/metabolite transporter (DMT)-like permease
MLIIVTLFWGLSFVLMKNWQDRAKGCPGGPVVASSVLIALRMVVALPTVWALRPRLLGIWRRHEQHAGLLIGLVFFSGFMFQVVGLSYTTPARSSFITSLGSAWVPLLAWLVFRWRLQIVTLLGLVLGVAGTGILARETTGDWSWNTGDVLTLISSAIFAVEILLLDRLGRVVDSGAMTPAFLVASACGGLAVFLSIATANGTVKASIGWTVAMVQDGANLRDLFLLSTLSTALAFYWMNAYQPHVSAVRAALIYLLEPLFGSAFSVIVGLDSISKKLVVGGSMILLGNLLAEAPRLVNGRSSKK